MNDQLSPLVATFNQTIREAENMLSIARDSELQRATIATLESLLLELGSEKRDAISRRYEPYANLLLGCEWVARALIGELRMWLLLKEEKPEAAWDQLIEAQTAAVWAARAHDGFRHLERYQERLEAIERLVFPSQVFLSSGLIVRVQECSICGNDYDDCDHIVGKPYMGEFCYLIARDLEADHVAIVEHPADKRCRVIGFTENGETRNRMTWRVEPTGLSS